MDDVMMSYAVDGGSVGPHFDNYDVFLLQGEGQRRWQLGPTCSSSTAVLPHDDLKILSAFECNQEYLLSPGDMLYIPPGVAHYGIAVGECTTFSIGFRAPRINDMVSRWADDLLEHMDPERFYCDIAPEPAVRAGEIRSDDLERVRRQLQDAVRVGADPEQLWFGAMVTETGRALAPDAAELSRCRARLVGDGARIVPDAAARIAWQEARGKVVVFANGEAREFGATVLPNLTTLCTGAELEDRVLASALSEPETARLVDYLLQAGVIYVE
jgi:50S ribosomal protein L16 3-hydroxylase